jgi:DNA replication and repair protein RecF
MQISKLQLSNFRNFKDKLLEFSDETTVIIGPNASGKTNILESIYLLSTGRSMRASVIEEMVNYDEEIARVKGLVVNKNTDKPVGGTLEAVLTRGEITIGDSPEKTEKVAKKRLLVNGQGKRMLDFAGTFKAVLFGPWDMDLVTESPSVRRKFMDEVISQVDREYRRASLSYRKGLRQRNKLLYKIREEGLSRSQLVFWNKLLIKNGDYISSKRAEFIDFVNSTKPLDHKIFELEYDKSAISDGRITQYAKEEVAAATTLVGPHRDDFFFKVKDKGKKMSLRDLSKYGSRGEQRMGVLWLKLAELDFIKDVSGEEPALLLDDIFSELDDRHREIVISASRGQQTIITTADPHTIEESEKLKQIVLRD